MPSRRSILRRAPLVFGAAAGCLGGRGSEATDGERTAERPTTAASPAESPGSAFPSKPPETSPAPQSGAFPTESVRTVGGVRVAVANPVAAPAVADDSIMGSGGVLAPEGRQFVVAAAASAGGGGALGAGGPPEYDAFGLAADGETYPAVDVEPRTGGAYTTSLAGRGRIRYAAPTASDRRETGWVAFEVPSPLDVSEAAVRVSVGGQRATWTLPDDGVRRLGRPAPTFRLRSFGSRLLGDGRVELSLAAENVSDGGGEFLAAVYWPTERIAADDESHLVRRRVDAGGRTEWSSAFETRYTGGDDGAVTAGVDGVVSGSTTVDLPATASES
jgi:hypothetical protein